jgi:hypothetical protein
MNKVPTHYLSPKLEVRPDPEKGGFGVFAREAAQVGEVLVVWGGNIVTEELLEQLPPVMQHHAVQIDEGLYLATVGDLEPADYVNHSCEPNLGLRGQITLVALRNIQPGEEVCFDYAMTDSTPYDEFECHCALPTCRKVITGNDWQLPELWAKYQGYFSPYLQRRIEQLAGERGLLITPIGITNQAWLFQPRELVEVPVRRS